MKLWSNPSVQEVFEHKTLAEISDAVRFASRQRQLPALRLNLFRFIAAAQFVRQLLEKKLGSKFWAKAEKAVADNGLAVAYIALFRRLVRSERSDAVLALQRLPKKGLAYELPAGGERRHTPPDHGIAHLADVVEIAATLVKRQQQMSRLREASDGSPGKIVIAVENAGLYLQFKQKGMQPKEVLLRGNEQRLVLALHSTEYKKLVAESRNNNRPDEFVWDCVWNPRHIAVRGRPFRPDSDGGANNRLRRLICDFNSRLSNEFGLPKNGRWIERHLFGNRRCYVLTSKINWVEAASKPFRRREIPYDTTSLDKRQLSPGN